MTSSSRGMTISVETLKAALQAYEQQLQQRMREADDVTIEEGSEGQK